MSFLEDFQKSLGVTEDLRIIQNFLRFECTGRITLFNQNLADELKKLFKIVGKVDVPLNLSITVDGYDTQRFSAATIDKFDERVDTLYSNFSADNEINFQLESVNWKNLNIFDIETFKTFIKSESLDKILRDYSKYFDNNLSIVNIFDCHNSIANQFFYIRSVYPNFDEDEINVWKSKFEREKILEDKINCRDKVSHFVNADKYGFIPECFDFKEKFFLEEHFKYLKSIFNLIFLSDYSNINENILSFKIKGYKTLNCKLNNKLPTNVENELASLYDWVYGDGPFVDKIGIARNVISIHITEENIETLEVGTCNSAQSGYDLYLKDNVKQYIEVKNKIADVLYTQSEKASGIVKDMFTMFKTSMWTFVTFFITTLVLRTVKVIDSENINTSIFFAGLFLILLSSFYIIFARKEVATEIIRLKEKYKEISNRYKDLLNSKDLEKILNQSYLDNKSPEEREISYIKKKRYTYTLYWVSINFILLILWLSIFHNIVKIYISKILNFLC